MRYNLPLQADNERQRSGLARTVGASGVFCASYHRRAGRSLRLSGYLFYRPAHRLAPNEMNDSQVADLVKAIERMRESYVKAKDAELSHLREINSTLTGISTHLSRISQDTEVIKDKVSKP